MTQPQIISVAWSSDLDDERDTYAADLVDRQGEAFPDFQRSDLDRAVYQVNYNGSSDELTELMRKREERARLIRRTFLEAARRCIEGIEQFEPWEDALRKLRRPKDNRYE